MQLCRYRSRGGDGKELAGICDGGVVAIQVCGRGWHARGEGTHFSQGSGWEAGGEAAYVGGGCGVRCAARVDGGCDGGCLALWEAAEVEGVDEVGCYEWRGHEQGEGKGCEHVCGCFLLDDGFVTTVLEEMKIGKGECGNFARNATRFVQLSSFRRLHPGGGIEFGRFTRPKRWKGNSGS